MVAAVSAANCEWVKGRWHCAGRGIHAGEGMDLRAADVQGFDGDGEPVSEGPGAWVRVRIESSDSGAQLHAHLLHEGLPFVLRVDGGHELRWPK